jgi:hypothetical protein
VSQYFAVSSIDKYPVESCAARKRMKVAEVGRWLSPILGDDSARK